MEMLKYGNIEIWKYGNIEIFASLDKETGLGSAFPIHYIIYIRHEGLLYCALLFVIREYRHPVASQSEKIKASPRD